MVLFSHRRWHHGKSTRAKKGTFPAGHVRTNRPNQETWEAMVPCKRTTRAIKFASVNRGRAATSTLSSRRGSGFIRNFQNLGSPGGASRVTGDQNQATSSRWMLLRIPQQLSHTPPSEPQEGSGNHQQKTIPLLNQTSHQSGGIRV